MRRPGGGGGCLAALLLCVGLCACYSHKPDKSLAEEQALSGDAEPSATEAVAAVVNPVREFNEDAALDAAHDHLLGSTYDSEIGSSDCTDDCSGHEAGWLAARDDGLECDDVSYDSFHRGCLAYHAAVEQQVDNARKAFNSGDNTFTQ